MIKRLFTLIQFLLKDRKLVYGRWLTLFHEGNHRRKYRLDISELRLNTKCCYIDYHENAIGAMGRRVRALNNYLQSDSTCKIGGDWDDLPSTVCLNLKKK
jgi:hypothetical protein